MTGLEGLPLTFLGAIALATTIMAVVQLGVILYAARLARRIDRLADRVERDVEPLITRLNEMSSDAARVTSLAVAQVERADRLFADVATRADHLLSAAQQAVIGPVREGRALMDGLRAGLAALRRLGHRGQPAARVSDDEEALFIG